MGYENLIQFITFLGFLILIFSVWRSGRHKEKILIMIYLVASASWSFTSFMCTSPELSESAKYFWTKPVVVLASWALVSYSCLVTSLVSCRTRFIHLVGYGYVLLLSVLTTTGLLHQGYQIGGLLPQDFGTWMVLIAGVPLIIIGYAVTLIVNSYRTSTDPEHRNRLKYFIFGLSLFIINGFVWLLVPSLYYVDQVGQLINASLIVYVIISYRILDIELIIRKSIVYTGIILFLFSTSALLTVVHTRLVPNNSLPTQIAIFATIAILFNPLRRLLEKLADILFYGKNYDYRQTLLNLSGEISKIIDLNQLAEAILLPLTNAIGAKQASLLFLKDNFFTSKYDYCYAKNESAIPVTISQNGPILKWLSLNNQVLTQDIICQLPDFENLSNEDKKALRDAEIEVLCPIKSKNQLVAILALSKKYRRGHYSRDDIDLLMTLSNEAAVAIENAELYEKAKQRANIDELSGLFNHSCFHQRLNEEIARSTRFGKVFSLIILDVDKFKVFNDVSGHLIGDDVLRYIGKHIQSSVRDSDICFRYGGDEFAIILPETSIEGGLIVGERIRLGIENQNDWPGIPLTVSIGIASWPTDGVIKNDLIHSADAALYHSKQTGKNRSNVACEVALSEVFRVETSANRNTSESEAVLQTIYTLAMTVDAKDPYTCQHSKNVSIYATAIAEAMGFDRDGLERIRVSALLHDIGMIGIPDSILKKNGPLTLDERQIVRSHPNLGLSIIQHVEKLRGCLAGIQYHHEHYDGSGYPSGLNGENIPLDARILAIADAFDAMTSSRSYRKKLDYEEALVELERCSNKQFDPNILKIFLTIVNKIKIPVG